MTRARIALAPTGIGMFVSSREGGHVAGADLQMLNDGLRVALQLQPSDTGAFVVSAPAGGPAGQSGLRSGDVIVRAAGRRVTDIGMIMRAVFEAPSRSVELEVLRAEAPPGGETRGLRRRPVTITLRW
jgi:S1-C subfamily serine protease